VKWAYGYRVDEVPLPVLTDIKRSACISLPREVDLDIRPPVAVSLGPILDGVALPHPDPHDPLTTMTGVMKRYAIETPAPDVQLLAELGEYVDKWLKNNMVPLEPDVDTSNATWLSKTNYPAWRKENLRDVWDGMSYTWGETDALDGGLWKSYTDVKSFMKDETYIDWKYARGINARSDQFKCIVGPIFRLIEERLYQHPAFIKHIPVADRAEYITKLLERASAVYLVSDYTAFESLFVREIMEKVEFKLYEYMTSKIPEGQNFMELVREVLGGVNTCQYKNFRVLVEATRMSGEMCTSLGNGFANLMFMLFVLEKSGCRDVLGVVEGDDGLFVSNGRPDETLFTRLGLRIKLETHTNLADASFCGMVFAPEDRLVVVNPLEVLAEFGWASATYWQSGEKTLRTLLRCKALSLAHQYPGCPVISELAWYGLRVTRDVRKCKMWRLVNSGKAFNSWERDRLIAAMKDEAKIVKIASPTATRLLVERRYGITLEIQSHLEKMLAEKSDLGPIYSPLVRDMVPESWRRYAKDYTATPAEPIRPQLDVPSKKITLPCERRGDWLVGRDCARRDLPFLLGRRADLSGRVQFAY